MYYNSTTTKGGRHNIRLRALIFCWKARNLIMNMECGEGKGNMRTLEQKVDSLVRYCAAETEQARRIYWAMPICRPPSTWWWSSRRPPMPSRALSIPVLPCATAPLPSWWNGPSVMRWSGGGAAVTATCGNDILEERTAPTVKNPPMLNLSQESPIWSAHDGFLPPETFRRHFLFYNV